MSLDPAAAPSVQRPSGVAQHGGGLPVFPVFPEPVFPEFPELPEFPFAKLRYHFPSCLTSSGAFVEPVNWLQYEAPEQDSRAVAWSPLTVTDASFTCE